MDEKTCGNRWILTALTYGIVAILAMILAFRGVHTAFIWPTLSTLVAFNVFLHAANYVKRFCRCIVGGLAWEGFMFYRSARTKLEEDYVDAVAIFYRNY